MKHATAYGPKAALLGLLALVACGGEANQDAGMDPGQRVCERDESEGPDTLLPLAEGMAEGFICPRGDQDWYSVDVQSNEALVRLALEVTAMRTPVQALYSLWTREGESVGTTIASPPPQDIGRPLNVVHCVDPGSYLLEVRDRNDDGQDIRHPYRLSVETLPEPDVQEPNNTAETATPLVGGDRKTGAIACLGDQDWYTIDVPTDTVLRVRLTSAETSYRPHIQIRDEDGSVITEDSNEAASIEATNIDIYRVLPAAGRYHIVVADLDLEQADPETPYEILVDIVEDLDPNEPNNHPDDATSLSRVSEMCTDSWGEWLEMGGTIGSPGDVDWFVMPVMGCAGGLIEAELRIATGGLSALEAWRRQASVQASLSLVRSHPTSPCAEDDSCRTLAQPCSNSYDCEGYFDACGADGLCVGQRICLPGGLCAANMTQRNYSRLTIPDSPSGPPPPNRAYISAPIPPDERIYFRVSDFQSNGGDPNAAYSLRVRVRRETDIHEVNNVYRNRLSGSPNLPRNQARAVRIPVHDCTLPPPADGGPGGMVDGAMPDAGAPSDAGAPPMPMDCCDETTWVTGAIGYEDDIDYFRFDHPCPGQDCMMRVLYQADDGTVEHRIAVYQGTTGWGLAEPDPGSSGAIGGLGETDRCFYAFRDHSAPYFLEIRDRATDQRDHDPDVEYRVCVERISRFCEAPCYDYPDGGGCGLPPSP